MEAEAQISHLLKVTGLERAKADIQTQVCRGFLLSRCPDACGPRMIPDMLFKELRLHL